MGSDAPKRSTRRDRAHRRAHLRSMRIGVFHEAPVLSSAVHGRSTHSRRPRPPAPPRPTRPLRRGQGARWAAQAPKRLRWALSVGASRRAHEAGGHRPGPPRLRAFQRSSAERSRGKPRARIRASAALGGRKGALARRRPRATRPGRGRARTERLSDLFGELESFDPSGRRDPRSSSASTGSTRSSSSPASTSPPADRGGQGGEEPRHPDRAHRVQLGQPLEQGARPRAAGPPVRLERGAGARRRRSCTASRPRPDRRHRRRPLRLDLRAFARRPSGRAPADELGLDPARKTVLYLGSSAFVAPARARVRRAWIAALRRRAPGARDRNVLVRPHPGTVDDAAWAHWRPPGGAVVPPAVVRDRAQDLYDQVVRERRGRRPEHERRDRGRDRRPARADGEGGRARSRPGGLVPLPLPARRRGRLRPDRPRRSQSTLDQLDGGARRGPATATRGGGSSRASSGRGASTGPRARCSRTRSRRWPRRRLRRAGRRLGSGVSISRF